MVTTDMGNEFQGLEQALPDAAVHRQKRPEDRNAAVIDRAIQTLKKDLAGRAAREGGGWAENVEQVTSAYNKRPHQAVHAALEDVEKQPATTFRVYQDNAQNLKVQAQRHPDEEPAATTAGGGGLPSPDQCGEELPAPVRGRQGPELC